jgi:hypothetical protein
MKLATAILVFKAGVSLAKLHSVPSDQVDHPGRGLVIGGKHHLHNPSNAVGNDSNSPLLLNTHEQHGRHLPGSFVLKPEPTQTPPSNSHRKELAVPKNFLMEPKPKQTPPTDSHQQQHRQNLALPENYVMVPTPKQTPPSGNKEQSSTTGQRNQQRITQETLRKSHYQKPSEHNTPPSGPCKSQ